MVNRAPDTEDEPILKELVAGEAAAGKRLDQWLAGEFAPDLSRSRIQALIEAGMVAVNGAVVTETKRKLKAGDVTAVTLPVRSA